MDRTFPNNPPLLFGIGIPKHLNPVRCNNGINRGSTLINGSYVLINTLNNTTLFLSILSHNKSEKFSNGLRNDGPRESFLCIHQWRK